MNHKVYFKMEYHYENIPKVLQKLISKNFMQYRNRFVDLFNAQIDEVNSSWKATGKPFAFGDYEEDINPEYIEHIRRFIQPIFDVVNKNFYLCRYKIDEIGNIVGYVPFIKNSKVWFTASPLKD